MIMAKSKVIEVQQFNISITDFKGEDYICITDMTKAKTDESLAADVIKDWIRTRITLEFLGTWEKIYNPDFKVVEFDHFKMLKHGYKSGISRIEYEKFHP